MLPKVEDSFSNIFTHCLGAYYLLPKTEIVSEQTGPLQDFETVYASKEETFKKYEKIL